MNTLYIVAYVANKTGWYSISTDYKYLKKTWLNYLVSGDPYIKELSENAVKLAKGVICRSVRCTQ